MPPSIFIATFIIVCSVWGSSAKIGGWDSSPNTQYHIQTDEGPERYFRYQTTSGQYRKEKRLQDGTVVGTYGWVDADGFLRLRDYIADDKGYRIVRTKMVRVDTPQPETPKYTTKYSTTPLPPISLSDYLKEKNNEEKYGSTPKPFTPQVEINNNGYPSSTPAPFSTTTPAYVQPTTFRPYYNPNSIGYDSKYEGSDNVPRYDGVAFTHNGFRYYLPRQYHEEENLTGDRRSGSFGYIDPFGIRRVIYYNTSPGSGFVHRKNNRYVGFQSTPYDPRF